VNINPIEEDIMNRSKIFFVTLFLFSFGPFLFAKNIDTKENDRKPVAALENGVVSRVVTPSVLTTCASPLKVSSRSIVGTSTYSRPTCYSGRNIAKGADGTLHVAWCYAHADQPANRRTCYARSTDNGATWSAQIQVNDGFAGYRCAIAAHPTDPNIIAVAYSAKPNSNDDAWRIHVTRSLDGGFTWQPSVSVAGSVTAPIGTDIVFDGKGGLHVSFDSNTDNRIYWNYSPDAGKTWYQQPEQIDIGSSLLAAFGPVLAIDKNNNPHAIWGDNGGSSTWGDKEVYWNWRDMEIGVWMEVPPPRIQASSVGEPWPSMVFDSKNTGHLFADGIEGNRHVWYRTLKNGVWSDLTEFAPIGGTGQTAMASVAIDKKDNIYVTFGDNTIPGGSGQPWGGLWDFFSGTNISGDWKVVNLTADGISPQQSYADVARAVSDDGSVHLVFAEGADLSVNTPVPVNIIHMVAYPWPPEPTCSLTSLPDTYNKKGPFTVTAVTSDIEGYVASVKFHALVNGTSVVETDMEKLETDKYETTFSIDANVGDIVSFYATATDNEGYTKDAPRQQFSILEPQHPDAQLLLVYQNVLIDTFYTNILNKLGYTYELWNYDTHKGIDASVTTAGWKAIFVAGWGVSCVPTRAYADNPFALFLQSATADKPKYLCLASQDYLFSNNEPQGDVSFNAGDFAYDFFQLGDGVSDPNQPTDTTPTAGVPLQDSLLIGIEGDPISGSFAEDPYPLVESLANLLYYPTSTTVSHPNWMDYTGATGQGEDIFYAYTQGYGSGIKYDAGNFKTVFLPWMMDMALDSVLVDTAYTAKISPKAYTLMKNIMDWFNIISGVTKQVDSTLPKEYSLGQNYPNPFNPETSIRISLPRDSHVEVAIFNALGQKIRTLVSQKMAAGIHMAAWDGRNDSGQSISSGVYFYTIKAGDFTQTKKMIMIK
jgi:hypothetical protein